ncbi:hypothetical protein PgNI_06635 [Pyricularia grisea]|uniref:Cytochrome b5 heme-binding domain-containing protein n=1 Tax=Pyricularia grisea TaxID=148305 RepID=A0A6P8B5D2_PYRGI|nr:hypothetical protein PgNI_06635 [Pyricularia grisea]TLD10483.1 hypothetical protein PgNI_06635 [Pyricularia grisea]
MVEYTRQEVAKHDEPGNYWLILHGKVYNVSSYLDDHPGGKELLEESAGTDATSDFDFAGHSEDAIKALDGFLVGSLVGYTEKNKSALTLPSPMKNRQAGRAAPSADPGKMKAYIGVSFAAAALTLASWLLGTSTHILSGFPAGVLSTLAVVLSVGWYCAVSVRKALIPGEDVFRYPSYF